jgi:hypothetical protein
MRIKELLESRNTDKNDEFVRHEGDKKVINYDLVEDLAFFMNDDDETYRRHFYAPAAHCIDKFKSKKSANPSLFTHAVKESYKNYLKKFKIRELPEELESAVLEEVCKKVYEDLKKDFSDGKYKD